MCWDTKEKKMEASARPLKTLVKYGDAIAMEYGSLPTIYGGAAEATWEHADIALLRKDMFSWLFTPV